MRNPIDSSIYCIPHRSEAITSVEKKERKCFKGNKFFYHMIQTEPSVTYPIFGSAYAGPAKMCGAVYSVGAYSGKGTVQLTLLSGTSERGVCTNITVCDDLILV